ncbi:MAG TPA: hypothetical protein VK903_01155 [Propionicimonas sp.]|nr:hypothetical protein [Propionicimonas sp.]
MTNHTHTNHDAEMGLPVGLGDENTQPGPNLAHVVEPDSLVFGLGSAETQSDAQEPGHVAIDHTHDADESGLPVGLGAENTQPGPDVNHVLEPDSLEYGLGSPETQHGHNS